MRFLLNKRKEKLWGKHHIIVENIGYKQVTLVSVFRAENGNDYGLERFIVPEDSVISFGPIENEVEVSTR